MEGPFGGAPTPGLLAGAFHYPGGGDFGFAVTTFALSLQTVTNGAMPPRDCTTAIPATKNDTDKRPTRAFQH